ncbi:hypothetical protein GcC1_019031 [Golovinomyces cichoracearum]|uniref:C2H2-type domain-containing protein n=1 Tax=Golovinomyces cichoracearum TaxID=62708 RepID=A0A420J5F5_9PEZI|nr:hypothetical protein GcC1_019031 [Golovinomyces cichoracearum]
MPYWTPTSQSPSEPYQSEPSVAPSYGAEYNFLGRHSYSPVASEGVMVSHCNLPPYANHISLSGPREDHHQLSLQHHQYHQQHITHTQQPHTLAPQGPLHASDSYGGRSPVSPIPYSPNSSLHQNAVQLYSPVQSSHQGDSMNLNRISPVSGRDQENLNMVPQTSYQRPFGGYTLPAMAGPLIPQVQSSDEHISMMNSNMPIDSYSQNIIEPSLYEPNHIQPQVQSDRPFKCDQCPQSFNRNHDLKRHKRIHLAVKPFPCLNCEKSFSRKDALKRHILVKSCGGGIKSESSHESDSNLTPKIYDE